jgi:hypothetical protein
MHCVNGHCKPLIPGSTQSSQLCDLRREFIRLQLIDSTFANSSGRQFWWKRYVTLVPHDRIARHAVISKSPDSWQLSSRQKQSAQTPHRVRSRKSVKNVSKADSTIGCCSGTPQAMRDDRDHAPMVHARRSPRTVRPGRIFARENARDITAGGLCCKRKSYRPKKSCDGSSNPPSATFPLCVLFLRLPQRLREHNAQ